MNATERMALFIVETRLESIPASVVAAAKTAILDTIGVALAGASEPVGRSIVGYVRDMGAAAQATVLGSGLRSAVPWVALANGTLGHALEFDDSNWSLHGHASVGVLPAVLAQGEAQKTSGREIIDAFIVGFEVSSKLGAGMNMSLYYKGWHPTCALGAMGAAAAAAHLRGFDVEKNRLALGCAASQASGLHANFGTMTKPLHAGLAAEAGVRAAGLAAAGITANPQVLEAPSGFFETFCGAGNFRMADIVDRLGRPFVLDEPGNNLKPYPCCLSAHVSVDALRDLMRETGLSADDVERIDVELAEPNFLNLSHHCPKTGLEGKFSAEYILSRTLMDGALQLNTFTDAAVNDPAAQTMMKKIHAHLAKDIERKQGAAQPATVVVHTRDGRTLRKRGERSRGNADWPLTQEEIHTKFRDCAGRHLDEKKIKETIAILGALETLPDIRPLMSLLG